MRISAVLLLIVSLAACNSAKKNDDAVRQGVVEYLQSKGFDVPKAMNVSLKKVDMTGNDQADATVTITPTGGNEAQGMSMKYHLEQKSGKWTVTGRAGDTGHGGGMMPPASPGSASPHGGAMGAPAPGASGKMPSPEELPPANKK